MPDSSDKAHGEAFLARWSRLKRGQDVAPPAEREGAGLHPDPAPEANVLAPDAPALTDADMPPVESLDEASDFSGFLSEGVSEVLRRKALSKLFGLPVFNQLDGLNDYDEDYTQLKPLGDTITYQMRQWMERDKKKLEDEAAAREGEATQAEAHAEPAPVEPQQTPAQEAPAEPGEASDSPPGV